MSDAIRPKAGDIVSFKNSRGKEVVGEFIEYCWDRRGVYKLKFPVNLSFLEGNSALTPGRNFVDGPDDPQNIKVLSPKEVFDKMVEIFESTLRKLESDIGEEVRQQFRRRFLLKLK